MNRLDTIEGARFLNKNARGVLESDKQHAPMVFLLKRGKVMAILPISGFMQNGNSKDALEQVICKLIQDHDASGVVMITEAWVRKIQADDDASFNAAQKHGIQDCPDKEECLLVRVESDDGLNVSFFNPIIRDANGNPTLGTAIELPTTSGRFANFFRKTSECSQEHKPENVVAGLN